MIFKLLGKVVACIIILATAFTTKYDKPLIPSTTETNIYDQYSSIREIDWHINNERMNRAFAIQGETGFSIEIADKIVETSDKYGFSDDVLLGLIHMESEYDPDATGYNDDSVDMGLVQINSKTLPWLAKQIGKPDADPYNPMDAIEMGAWYLNYLRSQCDGVLFCALSRYNGDNTGRYPREVTSRMDQIASRMGIERTTR